MNPSFTTSFLVPITPDRAYEIINDVRGWWTGEIEGNTKNVGDEFTYRHGTMHRSKKRITQSVPGKRVVWHVLDSELSFVADKSEWNGTDIVFEIERKGDETEVKFTHVGLVPSGECFERCSAGWTHYVSGALRKKMMA